MALECNTFPSCKENCELQDDNLPSRACDSEDYECQHCGHVFMIGWYATVEIRKP